MQYLFILSLFVTSQIHSNFDHVEKLKQDIKKIQESVIAPFDKKIEKEEKKLSTLSAKIQQKKSFKTINSLLEELKSLDLYKQKTILEESLKVIKDLLNYTITMDAPQLLASVSKLIETPGLTSELKPFLYKQRARLMDSLDEGLFSASLAKQIHVVQNNLLQEFEFCVATLLTDPLCKELATLHAAYLTEKETRQALTLVEKIITLECDKCAALYKNKELQVLTSKPNFYLLETSKTNQLPVRNESTRIPLLIKHQYKLLLMPLDISIL